MKKRVRRAPEDARQLILDAAEAELLQRGPSGLRLMEVAAGAGVSHSVILHHFGSRGGLLQAVVERALAALRDDLLDAMASSVEGDPGGGTSLVQQALRVLRDRGHARLVVWLLLSDDLPVLEQTWVRDIAVAAHSRRAPGPEGARSFEDTLFRTMLAGIAVFGEAVIGETFVESAGLAADVQAPSRFRAWMAQFIAEWLQPGAARPADPGVRARGR